MMVERVEQIILLVEDEEDDVFLLRKALKAAGVKNRAVVARDGNEAVEYLAGTGGFADRQQFPYPALMLLDLKLPYRSGLEVLAWLRRQTNLPPTHIAVLSSSNEPRDLRAASELGAGTYLVKPPTSEMVYDVIRRFNLGWLQAEPAQ
jgi:CheY-like chemotaxis protein